MNCELIIHWNPSLTVLGLRWYSLCWLVGLLAAYLLMKKLYRQQMYNNSRLDELFIYCFVGIIVGARLGHCLFYQPDYYLASWQNVVEMFVPIKFTLDGGWRYTGYEGLASHGGTLGLMLALWLYVRRTGIKLWTLLDNIAIVTPVTACFIRLGNLMNSEIIGKPTDVPWAFIFERIDDQARHPGQLYEAMAYALLFIIGWSVYRRCKQYVGTGFFFGLCLTYIFTARFFIEYTKDIQVDFEQGLFLNMGQMLSIPFVILGIVCMWRARKSVS